ncbi:MAG: organomercurial lyase [Thermoplasmata archaeon]
MGRSRHPTDHVLQRGARRTSLCCAVDILLNARGAAAIGTTKCPICGGAVTVRTRAGAVERCSPPGSVVSAQEVTGSEGRREVCCAGSAIFDSEDCLRTWARSRPDIPSVVQSVEEYARRCCDPGFRREDPVSPARR